jgi:hypothetical protein
MKAKGKKAPQPAKPATPSRGMLPIVRAAIAAGKSDAAILELRRPGIPITPGVVAYARRTGKGKAAPKKATRAAPKQAPVTRVAKKAVGKAAVAP